MGKLKFIDGRVIIKIDVEGKNSHKFADGTVLRLERDFNNFNRRETQPVNAIVLSSENIPEGSEILIGHNALHDSNKIFNYGVLSGSDVASDIKYYSIPESDCFAWRDSNGELKPMKNFAFALRVYRPYKGTIVEITPATLKDVLYITTGKLKGNICHVLKASDYEVIFQGQDGKEDRIIRCRHFPDEINEREEIIAVSHSLTKELKDGELKIGLSPSTSKKLK